MTKQTQGSMVLVGAIAGGVGFVAFVALMTVGNYNVSPAVFLAVLVAAIAAAVLFLGFHKGADARRMDQAALRPSEDGKLGDRTAAPGSAGIEPGTAGVEPGSVGSKVKPSKSLAGQADLAARKGDWRYEKAGATAGTASEIQNAEASTRSAAAMDKDAALGSDDGHASGDAADRASGDAATGAAVGGSAEAMSGPADTADRSDGPREMDKSDAPGIAAVDEVADDAVTHAGAEVQHDNPGTQPARLDGPRDGGADDLKMIKGVGPKLENMLHDMGFYHFDQIANWTDDEVAWVDQNLEGFKGRVSRDNWVSQAKTLASGEQTEFSQRADYS